jgi:hypothetical protein
MTKPEDEENLFGDIVDLLVMLELAKDIAHLAKLEINGLSPDLVRNAEAERQIDKYIESYEKALLSDVEGNESAQEIKHRLLYFRVIRIISVLPNKFMRHKYAARLSEIIQRWVEINLFS